MVGSLLKKTGLTIAATLVVAMCVPNALQAQQMGDEAALELEFIYLERLEAAGFMDIAEAVLKDIEVKYPSAKVDIKVKKLAQLLARGKFDEARAQIAKEPDQNSPEVWGMKCTMADYYFAFGKYDEAFAEYKLFFDKFKGEPPEALRKIYNESYYKFTQMLLMLDRTAEALDAYETMRTSNTGMPIHMQRQIAFENAELLVRLAEENPAKKEAYIARATPIVENILWTQDLWFARAVALLAHIKVVNGDIEGANDVIQDNMPMIRQMDKQLMEIGEAEGQDYSRLSPLAECRYLVGKMFYDEAIRLAGPEQIPGANADKIKELLLTGKQNALTEFANVYIRYPASAWAPEAGLLIEDIKQKANQWFNLNPSLNITPEQAAAVVQKQFENASLLFNQNQFEASIEAYTLVVQSKPMDERSILGIGKMIRAANKLSLTIESEDDRLYYKILESTFIGHLAEYYNYNAHGNTLIIEAAGNELLSLAQYYRDSNLVAQADEVQQLYYKNYPTHSMSAQLLMGDAVKFYKEDNIEEALKYYQILADNYKHSPYSIDALKCIADCYEKQGDVDKEIVARKRYLEQIIAQEKPSHNLVLAQYLYARALKAKGVSQMRAGVIAQEEEKKAEANPSESEASTEEVASTEGAEGEEVEGEEEQKTPIQLIKEAQKILSVSLKYLRELEGWLSGETISRYQSNAEEAKINQNVLENLYFDIAHIYTSLYPPTELKYKLAAIKQYRTIREKFPESKNMPMVLMQLGTLLSSVKQGDEATDAASMKEAQQIFAELAEKYPDSNEAKNAHFVQGKTLIELGYRTQGVAALKRMFENAQQYSAGQIYLAAEEIFESKDYDTALTGYTIAIEKAEGNDAIIAPSIYGQAKVYRAQKKYTEAVELLDEFQEKYPRSYLLIDILKLMSECGIEAARNESDVKKRIELFNSSMKAIKIVREYHKKSVVLVTEADLQMGIILETYAAIAEKWDDQQRADDYIRRASSQYQKIIMSADITNAEILPILEEAYAHDIPISLKLELYEEAKADSEKYLSLFPKGKYLSKIMLYKAQAEQGL